MVNTYFNLLKAFLALKIMNVGFFVASICIWFLDLTFFNFFDFLTVLSAMSPITTLSLSNPNYFEIDLNNSFVFNIEINSATILLIP